MWIAKSSQVERPCRDFARRAVHTSGPQCGHVRSATPRAEPAGHAGDRGDLARGRGAIGFSIARTREAYATSDGRGTIAIGADDTLDVDDAFAQLVFHELCHAHHRRGGGGRRARLGARQHRGARRARARLPALRGAAGGTVRPARADGADDRLPRLPRRARRRSAGARRRSGGGDRRGGARAVRRLGLARARSRRRWRGRRRWRRRATRSGFDWGPAGETCGGCAWLYRRRPRRARRALPADGAARSATARAPSRGIRACARWEPPVDCQACGACCREAYHSVTVSVRDPVVWQEPDLIVRHGHRFEIRREGESGERCAALKVAAPGATPRYACTIYDNRPKPCREFAADGRHCLDARRRVGLSAGAA